MGQIAILGDNMGIVACAFESDELANNADTSCERAAGTSGRPNETDLTIPFLTPGTYWVVKFNGDTKDIIEALVEAEKTTELN